MRFTGDFGKVRAARVRLRVRSWQDAAQPPDGRWCLTPDAYVAGKQALGTHTSAQGPRDLRLLLSPGAPPSHFS